MKKLNSLDMNLLEEVTQLEYFLVRKPMSSHEFWAEWQEKFGKATLAKIALKKIAKTRKLSHEEYAKLRTMMSTYDDIIKYLEQLKNTALNVRGVVTNFNVEFDDEDIDLDF
ncbi:hypothetical protein BCF55_1871 [Hydrogenivirga caldilitoris]|uniref:Uncharacterized protein n=1 Tax=Hydrogenivirga caldilitoris TaxID=246264 RepID=A0A497XRB3_9AQUI|nr:hypothetical protein [Hydrogenivirga caldilitoris]RLJ71567.1 hypothetical protein BCF55_1871 [Hydrogenivirga caldilitoris]